MLVGVTAAAVNKLILCHDISQGSVKQVPDWSSSTFIFVTFTAMTYIPLIMDIVARGKSMQLQLL